MWSYAATAQRSIQRPQGVATTSAGHCIPRVRPLAGGLNAWREHNYPIELRDVPKAIKATVESNL